MRGPVGGLAGGELRLSIHPGVPLGDGKLIAAFVFGVLVMALDPVIA